MKRITAFLLITLMLFHLSACGSYDSVNYESVSTESETETGRVYECDYKSLNLNTKITTTYDGSEISISGNIFRLLTDPLTVTDSDGNTIGYAGDAYGVIEQDDHGIYVDDNFEINMCGNFDVWGNSYRLKDSEGNIVANADFNMSNTYGSIKDTDGNLIATYSSMIGMNDYTVTIYDNDICSDMSILMIVASYVSDYKADNS